MRAGKGKRGSGGIVLGAGFRPIQGEGSIQQQLYAHLRDMILCGHLSAGVRLPSTRVLASEIGVSRNTALAVFEQLQSEGYISSRVGSGTRVSELLPEDLLSTQTHSPMRERNQTEMRCISSIGQQINSISGFRAAWNPAFSPGMCAINDFPFQIWSKLLAEEWRNPGMGALNGDPGGYWPLREQITEYVSSARGVQCDADQVIIVSGNREGTELAARVLLDPGDSAIVEDPGYPGIRFALASAGVRTLPIPVDENGLLISEATQAHRDARMLCTAPSHHYPLGHTMSLSRRIELLDWCRKNSCWILEDDYDSEFRYSDRPLPSLASIDPTANAIYVGTFSKTLFPSLRIGYLIVPKDLIGSFINLKMATRGPETLISQRAVSKFFEDGHFYRHIRKMRRIYAIRRTALEFAIRTHLPEISIAPQEQAGLFLVTTFSADLSKQIADVDVAKAAREAGLHVESLSALYLEHDAKQGLIFGFGALQENSVDEPMQRLAKTISHCIAMNQKRRAPELA